MKNETASSVGVQDDAANTSSEGAAFSRKRLRRPLIVGAPIIVLLGVGYYWLTGGRYESTDDAYVQAARVPISSNVAGRVTEIAVRDNQIVRRGETLFVLDDAPFRIAVEQAKAQLATARLQVDSLKSSYLERQAELRSAKDTFGYQRHEYERQTRLLKSGIASQAQVDRALHASDEAWQQVNATKQQMRAVLGSLGGNPDIRSEQHPTVQEARARLDLAELNLSYTVIRAPNDGIVTKVEQLQAGTYISASTPVFALVSTQEVWIEANFKEVQLTHMRRGQPGTVIIDSYPGMRFPARVVSISPGTGSTFSILPPENSTGNWVKVVQRLPIRLEIENANPLLPLYSGLSANVRVDTGYRRHPFGYGSQPGNASAAER
jgi:membrane fusion protein (multidrug efflux system)